MEIVHIADFKRSFRKLPKYIQRIYSSQEKRFVKNWRDPRLHVKKIRTLPFAFSLRITRRYRVFFYFQTSDTAIFFEIDHRKDIYR